MYVLNENLFNFLATFILATIMFYKIFPLSILKKKYPLKKTMVFALLIQSSLGLMFTLLLTICHVITTPWIFLNKKLILKNGCQEFSSCIEERGLFYLPNVAIQYSTESGYFKIIFINEKNETRTVLLSESYILGWE